MEKITDYDSYLLIRKEKIERRLSIYAPVLQKKGFVTEVISWWETVQSVEPVCIEDEEIDALSTEEQTEYVRHPGIPANGYVSLSVRHEIEDEDDAIVYIIPVCNGCGGEDEQLDIGKELIDATFLEIAKIARKGKLGYLKIKRKHINEVMENLLLKSKKSAKTGVIVTISIVGAVLVAAAIAMIIVL